MTQQQNDPIDPDLISPKLTDAQIARMRPFGQERSVAADEILFREADLSYDLTVVLEGVAQVFEDREMTRQLAVDINPRQFLGEMGLLTGETVYATAKMAEAGRILTLTPDALRDLLGHDQELSNVILRTFAARRGYISEGSSGLTLVGSRSNRDASRLAAFAQRNYLPVRWLDLEDDAEAVVAYLAEIGRTRTQLDTAGVIAVWGSEAILANPSNLELARTVGLGVEPTPDEVVDVAIVGAGPGGLAAAVYGASEGLQTVLIDAVGGGGQAGASSRIENYLGFPAGLSGAELANRAMIQARKFGAKFVTPYQVTALTRTDNAYTLKLEGGGDVCARVIVIATGVHYRRLPLKNLTHFEGAGVYYAATQMEARLCAGSTVAVVGGGNSAGQAAMYLSQRADEVLLILRGDSIRKSMSSYLADRIETTENIHVLKHTQVRELRGESQLEQIVIENTQTDEWRTVDCPALFLFIGAVPRTEWVSDECATLQVALDEKGFIKTGTTLTDEDKDPNLWNDLIPSTFETSLPGVFAVGDVRSGSTKRVAGAVGEGSVAVKAVHERLALYGA